MQNFLYHDLVVAGNWCNLKCSYCTSTEDAGEYGEETSVPEKRKGVSADITDILNLVDGVLAHNSAPLMKISGGEIFLLNNAVELLGELSKRYSYVQILTNGTELSTDKVQAIAAIPNLGFNLSLDGHTPEMNAMRWKSVNLHKRVMDALADIVRLKGELEITSVISNANAAGFADFLEFLQGQQARIVTVPIPVRGVNAILSFFQENRALFGEFMRTAAQNYGNVLPPRAYCERLSEFLAGYSERRPYQCNLPNMAVQLFDTGALTPCPVGWTKEIANLRDGVPAAMAEVGRHKLYDLMTRPNPRVPVCRTCFAPSDVINLFFEGAVTEAEMFNIPLFSSEAAQARLRALKVSLGPVSAPQYASALA